MWIIFYDDGSSFASIQGNPENAPRDGVQVIANEDIGTGRLLWHSSDFYCWQEEEWVPRNFQGLLDYLRQPGASKVVLQGRAIKHSRFQQIYMQALVDPRLPFKSARDSREPESPLE